MQPICLVSRRRSGPGSVVTPRISRVITPAPLSNVTRGGTRIRSSSPPPPPKMVILVQRPFERVLSRGLTVAVYSSLFDRSKSKRMDPSQEQKKNIHIYIYIHIRNEDLFVVGPCPNRHVTNGVTSVTDTDLLSLSLSLFGYLRSRSDL